jgi:hypothetical protein
VPFAVIDGKLSRRPLDAKEQPFRPELHRAAALPHLKVRIMPGGEFLAAQPKYPNTIVMRTLKASNVVITFD